MSGTPAGGQQLILTMIEKYGSEQAWRDHMKEVGSKGGKNGHSGGFNIHEVAVRAGRIGGSVSTRLGIKNGEGHANQKPEN